MGQATPKVSVVMAVFNGAATLERSLQSFAAQTYPAKELIVMDGGSTDGSTDILQRYDAHIAHWESTPDRGIYHAWNKALAHTSGEWVCFVGADDFFWTADALTNLAPHLARADEDGVRVVYGQIAVINAQGATLRYEGQDWDTSARTFTRAMNLPHPGLMHRRTLFDEHGPFDDTLHICADYDLLLRELPRRAARFAPDVAVLGVQHGGVSYAPRHMASLLQELEVVRRKHGLPTPGLTNSPPVLWKMRLAALLYRWGGEGGFARAASAYRRLAGKPAA